MDNIFTAETDFEGLAGAPIPSGTYKIIQTDGSTIIIEAMESKRRFFTNFRRLELNFKNKKTRWENE